MDFQIAVEPVGLAGQHALDLHLLGFDADRLEFLLGLGDRVGIALGLAEFDHHDRVLDRLVERLHVLDLLLEPGAFLHKLLGPFRIVPQALVLGQGIELGQSCQCDIPVKDASSAVRSTA